MATAINTISNLDLSDFFAKEDNVSVNSEPKTNILPTTPGLLAITKSNLVFFSEQESKGFIIDYTSIIIHAKSKKHSEPQTNEQDKNEQKSHRFFGDCVYCQLDFLLKNENDRTENPENQDPIVREQNEEDETDEENEDCDTTELFFYSEDIIKLEKIYAALSDAVAFHPVQDDEYSDTQNSDYEDYYGEIDHSYPNKNRSKNLNNGTGENSSNDVDMDEYNEDNEDDSANNGYRTIPALEDGESEFFYTADDLDKLSSSGKVI
ncbi:hypothetical protein BB559_003270 [Furculomyces boomerangus]|uniref:Uncharacterized protein n=1 Tax=Furculomyces boomerangus TaxID=61424 RepID=A0A2T9YM98_9FUNG|nr:hypothetical protein BB559_003270 [Furculomyces boomerangus]